MIVYRLKDLQGKIEEIKVNDKANISLDYAIDYIEKCYKNNEPLKYKSKETGAEKWTNLRNLQQIEVFEDINDME